MADAEFPRDVTRRLVGQLKARKREIARLREPVAIVGAACRFPGARGTDAFRRLLEDGVDTVCRRRPRVGERPGAGGESQWGAFLEEVEEFDAEFFQIAPVEVEFLDPQHRLLLETCWEALENAGLAPERLRGSRTGVYGGISSGDYREVAAASTADDAGGLYLLTGNALSTAVGRVAFTLGFRGPAIAVDTACSSSLVAVHQAAAGLQSGDADLALAGGVNLILTPGLTRILNDAGMLAADGRCKTFDAAADGYVRGEGCGVVVLKRLSDARADGHRILGVLAGSAVNQDGASAGLTVPSGPAQARVIEAALVRAGIPPAAVDYLEAHGTGTRLGDPIEVQAAASVYGRNRPAERPLLLGSVKTNMGHLEAAAGVAGLIKVLLSLEAGVIPRHLHFRNPSPAIPWDRLPVRVVSEPTPWPAGSDRPRRAAVSSFGFSGTNAHVIVEEFRPRAGEATAVAVSAEPSALRDREVRLLPLSGKTPGALAELAGRYGEWLTAEAPLADAAWTAGVGRSHFGWRAGVVFRDEDTLRAGLGQVAEGGGGRESSAGKVAFLYGGEGGGWSDLGRALYESEPTFREVVDRCAAALGDEGPPPDVWTEAEEDAALEMAARYALQAGLTALWASVGVVPGVVWGCGAGEPAAARASGVVDLEGGLGLALGREFEGALSPPDVPLVRGASGRLVKGAPEAGTWGSGVGGEVRFGRALETLSGLGVGLLVEVGLSGGLGERASSGWPSDAGLRVLSFPSEGGSEGWVRVVGAAYEAGLPVAFEGLYAGEERRRVSVPTYPFQRERYWVEGAKARRPAGHPLLGERRDSRGGEISWERELSAGDPDWLGEHRVYGEALAPGALYASQALEAFGERAGEDGESGVVAVTEVQFGRPLVFRGDAYRTVQVVSGGESFEVASREGVGGEAWELHAEGRWGAGGGGAEAAELDALREKLSPVAVPDLYGRLASAGFAYGPAFRSLGALWRGVGEALGEVSLPPALAAEGLRAHPVLLDGCFQVLSGAWGDLEGEEVWLPWGWERLWVCGRLPGRLRCHARLREGSGPGEVRKADLALYGAGGEVLGEVSGLTLKRAGRSAVLGVGVGELLYEVDWRSGPPVGLRSAEFLEGPSGVASSVGSVDSYLSAEGLEAGALASAGEALERESRGYALRALEELGWERVGGDRFAGEELRRGLKVTGEHRKLFGRLLALLEEGGVLARDVAGEWLVTVGSEDPLPAGVSAPGAGGDSVEREVLARCGGSLSEVLRGRADAVELLFGEGGAGAAEWFWRSPEARALNRLVGAAAGAAVAGLPEGRGLRVLEVGAGTGATTGAVLAELPSGRTEYEFTDVSAGFLSSAERRFGDVGAEVRYRVLDIERDPLAQGFGEHGFDVLVAANVLHATRDLEESLAHCRRLLAPSGLLLVLEGTERRGWLDLTFGLLPGWWRFDDVYRSDYALVGREAWGRALSASGYGEVALVGEAGGQVVLAARGPGEVAGERGLFVLSGAGAVVEELAGELSRRGQEVRRGPTGGEREAWESFFGELDGKERLRGVVDVSGVGGDETGATVEELERRLRGLGSGVLGLLQGLSDAGTAPGSGLWLVTRGGQVVGGEQEGGLSGASLWGMGAVAGLEHGDLNVRLVDVDPEGTFRADRLADELVWPDRESRVALRGGERRVPRLVRLPAGSEVAGSRVRSDRSYLVTGGLGGLGLAVGGWLGDRGAGAVVLNGRRAPDAAASAAVASLRGRGVEVRVEIADVTDGDAVAAMLGRVEEELPPLGGVIHCAGVLSDGALVNLDWERFEEVLWPKVLGAWRLHRATEDRELELFVLFSSAAGVFGNAGQANHAAANAFLDQLAAHRRSRGLAGQAIAWGAWSGVGEAEEQRERIAGRVAAYGDVWMAPERGLEALTRLVRADVGRSVAASVDWASLPSPPPLLEELVRAEAVEERGVRGDLGERLRGLPAAEREAALVEFLREELASVLRLRSWPSAETGFFELGMDSLMAVELRNRVNRALGGVLTMSNTAMFDHPDATRLAGHLAGALGWGGPVAEVRQVGLAARPSAAERVAVVGMACRFPGGADLGGFGELLRSGGWAVTRGRPDGLFVDRATESARPYGAYVEGLDRFDAGFFRIAPSEAELLDPQQRLLLEVSWAALEDAGLAPGRLRGSRTGVYGGMMNSDYRELVAGVSDPARSLYRGSGVSFSTAVGRVSFALGLEGPAITVDTACSSSLVAVHQAAMGLLQGEADLALAGGVNAILLSGVTGMFADAGMLASDGRCKTFDASADGFVRGEGCGMVVLKRLSDAERDGDRVLGVLLGSAVNQDGASAGLTVPNGPAQERVIGEALGRAGLEPWEVDYLEAHGTGTELGDPVEVAAAGAVYGEGRDPERPLLVGSVKTNVGHLEGAAGVAGLIKVLLALGSGEIPRHLHFERPNPRIPWKELPVRVVSEATGWPATDRPRRAGVSSFGYSGTNAHVIVEDFRPQTGEATAVAVPAEASALREGEVRLLPLSGRSAGALRELAGRYGEWLGEEAPLADAAWTAGVGRSHFGWRAGVVFRDEDTLRAGLRQVAEGDVDRESSAGKVAFLYGGESGGWPGLGRELYGSEPAFREVVDRCAAALGDAGPPPDAWSEAEEDAALEMAARYALQAGLTALWASVGVVPGVVWGCGAGEAAAACASGVLELEDGLRLALGRDGEGAPSPPGVPLVRGASGRLEEGVPEAGAWVSEAGGEVRFERALETLSELEVGLLVEVGPSEGLGERASSAWPGDAGLRVVSVPAGGGSEGWVRAVGAAYEAGLPVAFEGLYAGERRRRVSLPTYPFQRERYWVEGAKARRPAGHPLLGERRDSRGGEVSWEREMGAGDPGWLGEHRVYGEALAPGALYASQALEAFGERAGEDGESGGVALTEVQFRRPLVFRGEAYRTVQVVSGRDDGFEVASRGGSVGEAWDLHAEGRWEAGGGGVGEAVDLAALRGELSPAAVAELYGRLASVGIAYGPAFRTLGALWRGEGAALGEVALPAALSGEGLLAHPVLLDGCFQVLSGAWGDLEGEEVWLPWGWERLWIWGRLPGRLVCHARLREGRGSGEVREADLALYGAGGEALGGVSGLALKRAGRSAVLGVGVGELLYEVDWRAGPPVGLRSAEFLVEPSQVASSVGSVDGYLSAEGLDASALASGGEALERESRWYALRALEELGWERSPGDRVSGEGLRRELRVVGEHERLFGRLLALLAEGGVLARDVAGEWLVTVGSEDPLPAGVSAPGAGGDSVEREVLARCGGSLSEVLRGRADAVELLFGEGGAGAAELYWRSPGARVLNRLVGAAAGAAVAGLPEGRGLRVLEVGAGTGATTGAVLAALPSGRTEYEFTDVSAGFLSSAERRFGDAGAEVRYRVLDIERDPLAQGFGEHGFDVLVAANVLHATRDLEESLAHCRRLLAPSGLLLVLEGTERRGWLDLTFGLLPGWWRFDDVYRSDYALVGREDWSRALSGAGYGEVALVGEAGGQMVLAARGPAEVAGERGLFVLSGEGAVAAELAGELSRRGQEVRRGPAGGEREAWESFFGELDGKERLRGVVDVSGVGGDETGATVEELERRLRGLGSGVLGLLQGLSDAGTAPASGLWLVTRGGQVLGGERGGALSGASLWGMGAAAGLEHRDLNVRLVDVDPAGPFTAERLADELVWPDGEPRVALRGGERRVPRLVRSAGRPEVPEDGGWRLSPGAEGSLSGLRAEAVPEAPLGAGEVRVAVEAAGVNFLDVMLGMGLLEEELLLGGEVCGRVVELGSGVSGLSVGDRVVGFAAGAFGPEAVTRAELLAVAPAGHTAGELATVPVAYVTAELAYRFAGLPAGSRVLIHAGTGGVGQAAIRLARAAGHEVYSTASAPKQEYLRSLGVRWVFDSRDVGFGEGVLAATGGEGVDLVLNSLTGAGFVEAGLGCLREGGCFVELGKRGIWSAAEVAGLRPEVRYWVLGVDRLGREDPGRLGSVLRDVVGRLGSGELEPLPFGRWPLLEAGRALEGMREARHVGKNVLVPSALAGGRLRGDRSYLVTGGLGGVGLAVAGWLAERGAGAIVLNGRRAPEAAASASVESLRGRGVEVRVEIADVTDGAAVAAMLGRVEEELPPLGGVLHCVGVLSDGALVNLDWGRFEEVLWPKVLGAWRLHRATEDRELELFVLFSSAAGVFGNAGQANHAAANAFLDQLAAHRRSRGLAGQAIAWGAWSGVGEAEEQRERIAGRVAAYGEGWMAPERGLEALTRLVRADVGRSVAVSVDWASLSSPPPLLEELVRAEAVEERGVRGDLGERLRGLPEPEREAALVGFLREELASVLRLRSSPAADAGFFELGMDSLMAVELRNRVNRALGGVLTMSNTAVFDHPDALRLGRHLAGALGWGGPAAEVRRVVARPSAAERVAVVGMACRFPGGADLAGFGELLRSGRCAVTRGRPDGLFVDGATESARPYGAYVEGLDRFDAGFFRIAPSEAELLDPQQRLLLEVSWAALEDAGLAPGRLRGSRTGVYGGVCGSEYQMLVASSAVEPARNLYRATGVTASTAVGRVSFALGLTGPAITVDTACSSSLVAVHQAAMGLLQGEADLALAGGVNAILTSGVTGLFTDGGMLAGDGRCKTFDASADGYVRGEGCGMVVLKRLSDAERDGDRVLGVLLGSAVNQDGASAGLTVPNGPSQERVIGEALGRAGLEPWEVDYLEAHGTGTELGDPVEVVAAGSVYGEGRDPERPLLLGSVKTNVGHLEGAAGVAGLIKVLLALGSAEIPRHLHFERPNPRIPWAELPVRVVSEGTGWPALDRPRRAGVSSFGYSGTNAHLVVESYETPAAVLPGPEGEALVARRWRVLPLSGKSEGTLRELAGRYGEWLGEEAPLSDAAWTAGVGRNHFGWRAGVVFRDEDTLRAGLRQVAEGAAGAAGEPPAGKIAFLYGGACGGWSGLGRDLYGSEPAFREVVDRCAAALGGEGRPPEDWLEAGEDAALEAAMRYALQAGLTALWGSVGVVPGVVWGCGVGEAAAASASGVVDLEGGLRLALGRGGEGTPSPPGVPLVRGASGRVEEGVPEAGAWGSEGEVRFERALETLSGLGVGLLVEVGPTGGLGERASSAWPGDEGLRVVSVPAGDGSEGWVRAVGEAYEAGLDVSFGGLFTGETRRRVSLPTYPFQRERYWVEAARGRGAGGHALLGWRRDGRDGEVSFETELSGSAPGWLGDHRVFGEVLAPGALYAAQVLEALRERGSGSPWAVEEVEIQRPLVFSEGEFRTVQVVLGSEGGFEVVSRGGSGSEWEEHAAGRVGSGAAEASEGLDLEGVRAGLVEVDPAGVYGRLAEAGIAFGPAFRGLSGLWSGEREALGEVALPAELSGGGLLAHPVLLDGCFQALSGVSGLSGEEGVRLPVGWERLWLGGPLPERVFCRVRLREGAGPASGSATGEDWKVDLGIHGPAGEALGGVEGLRLRRASRSSLLGVGVGQLLYEVDWRSGSPVGLRSAEFLEGPSEVASSVGSVDAYLSAEGLDASALASAGEALERESRWYALRALEELGWERVGGDRFAGEELRRGLKVTGEHERLFDRLLALLEEGGVLARDVAGEWLVTVGSAEPLPAGVSAPGAGGDSVERAVLARCGGSLSEVLRGRADAVELLFGEGGAGAAELYWRSPGARALNRLVGAAAGAAVTGLPENRRLRVLEVGAGTGATAGAVLAALPSGRTEYEFTDVSAGFLSSAERRFGDAGAEVRYRVLDIERDPLEQGFGAHGFDVVVAANVLHATRDLEESLAHCRRLLAPSGLLLVLEGTERRGWLDLTFGLLPGWWRFADGYRSDYALVGREAWGRALSASGYGEVALVGEAGGQMVLAARGPAEVAGERGLFVLSGERAEVAELAGELSRRGQEVRRGPTGGEREAWESFFGELDGKERLRGVVDVSGVGGDETGATVEELERRLRELGSGVLGLLQGLSDAGASPGSGLWLVTRGGQVVSGEQEGGLSGASLWGMGAVAGLEHRELNVQLVDVDPAGPFAAARLADELVWPDGEPRVALRGGERRVPRLVRLPAGSEAVSAGTRVRSDRSYLVTGAWRAWGWRSLAGWATWGRVRWC